MVRDHLWKQTLKADGEPVLELSQRMPQLSVECRAGSRIQRYYDKLDQVWKAHWESTLFPRACQALSAAREVSRPFQPWSASLTYRVTLETASLLSICVDAVQQTGQRPMIVRTGDTWDLKSGAPLAATEFLPKGRRWRRTLAEEFARRAVEQLQSGESLFYQDVDRRVHAAFDTRRFYLSDSEVVFFFPMLALGSAGEGIPLFSVPWAGSQPAEAKNSTSSPPPRVHSP